MLNVKHVGKGIKWVALDRLKVGTQWQRNLDARRVNKLARRMDEMGGFLDAFPILVTEDYRIIDGQHRLAAANKNKYRLVPIIRITLNSGNIKTAARFFCTINDWNSSLQPIDNWHARYVADHPVAKTLYQLNEDSSCMLGGRIRIRGNAKSQTFTIADTLHMLNIALFNSPERWTKQSDDSFTRKIETLNYNEILPAINNFCDFFFGAVGHSRHKGNKHFFRYEGSKAIAKFYLLAKEQGHLDSKGYSLVGSRLASFRDLDAFDIASGDGKLFLLVQHYNKRLKDKLIIPEK